ncbi:HNH endonuclease [Burkholderia gladioli]|uniref:HNH endonuclease n=1 Tax=Burkholderia gladioli TaxID=28095 RepID=UPI00202F5E28|nr:HNH endonuclease [Burkholderia gladioli]URV26499.1 HNH endonuclease [Burkholderia gladioli]
MIKLTKLDQPKILVDNAAVWTQTLLGKIASGVEPTQAEKTRYRNREIKAVLEKETAGKCAYCESKLKHIHHGDVEHIYPKSLDPSRQFQWDNLTLACEICNQNKSNRDPNLENIIDPYVGQPEEHICFYGPMAFALGTAEGVSSIHLLDLNRTALVEMRGETIKRIMGIFDMLFRHDLPLVVKRTILEDLERNESGASAQFSAVVQSIIFHMKQRLPLDLVEPPAR